MEGQDSDTIFALFVNSVSGSKIGKQYLTLAKEDVTFKTGNGQTIRVVLFDLFDAAKRQQGVNYVHEHYRVCDMRVIVCGGDGTVLWVVQEIVNAGVDVTKMVFGIIPIGTGNDFARTLGWGSSSVDFSDRNITELRRLVMEWVKADIKPYDIWDFELELYESGDIRKIEDKKETIMPTKSFKKSFSNYCGVGIDARVGYTFDKYRTRSVLANLMCYGCIGFAKMFKKSRRIEDLIDNMEYETVTEPVNIVHSEESRSSKEQNPSDSQKNLVFHTNKDYYGSDNHLKKGFRTIVCLNSTSFMAGCQKVWSTSKSAVEGAGKAPQNFVDQSFGDGLVEFVNFKSEIGLGLQKLVPGQSSKLAQGPGPFMLHFRNNPDSTVQTYFQVDGEYFKMHNPKSIKIFKTEKIKGSQIRVLCKRPS